MSTIQTTPPIAGMPDLAGTDLIILENIGYSLAGAHLTEGEASDVRARWDGDKLFTPPIYSVAVVDRDENGTPYIVRTMLI